MIDKFLATYRGNAPLPRAEFTAGVAAAAALLLLATFVHVSILAADGSVLYLIGQSFLELVFLLAVAPLVLARLRDLRWPATLAMILMPVWLFGPRNLALYDAAWNTGRGLWDVPSMIGRVSTAAALALLLLLIFMPSGTDTARTGRGAASRLPRYRRIQFFDR